MPLFAETVWESATKSTGDSVLHSIGVRLLGETERDRMAVFGIISYDTLIPRHILYRSHFPWRRAADSL